jgi:hypothetical protein
MSEDAIERLARLLARRLEGLSRAAGLESTPLLSWVLQIWTLTGVAAGIEETVNRLVVNDLGLINILDGLMGHAVSSDKGPFRSAKSDPRIAGIDRDRLQFLASEALHRDDFPIGIGDATNVAIARDLLRAYLESE